MQPTRTAANLTLVVASLIMSALAAEFVLRTAIPIDLGSSYTHRIPDPALGWVLEPDASYRNRVAETTVRVEYSSAGWRDVEHAFEKPPGVVRIVVLGDSYMEAYSVELEDAFHRRLRHLALEQGIDVEVINLGVGGYGTLQEYLAFREVGRRYRPDLVLLGFYIWNDVHNNSLELETMLTAGTMKVESRPFVDLSDDGVWRISQVDFAGARERYEAGLKEQRSLWRRFTRRSALAHLSDRLARKISRTVGSVRQVDEAAETRPPPPEDPAREMAAYGVHYCAEPPSYTRGWEITDRIIARLNKEVKAIGSKLVVFTVPALHEVSVDRWDDMRGQLSNPQKVCLEEAPGYDRLLDILNQHGLPTIDLLPYFREAWRDSGQTLFHLSDRHWNAGGHDLAARIVMSKLLAGGLITTQAHSSTQH